MFEKYSPILKTHYLSQYYQGLVSLVLERYDVAGEVLDECLKNVEECQWKFLYVKGLV